MTKFDYAVMGNPIAHSLSPKIHHAFAAHAGIALRYAAIEVPIAAFESRVLDFFHQGGRGLNITSPFKERAFKLCQKLGADAQAAQSVNTLWYQQGKIHGENTDGMGFLNAMPESLHLRNAKIVIYGAGGAARGLLPALLSQHPKKIIVLNRTLHRALDLQRSFPVIHVLPWGSLLTGVDLLIHASSSFPRVLEPSPASIKRKQLELPGVLIEHSPDLFCYDLYYQRHGLTPFLEACQTQGFQGKNGIEMLIEQAALAFSIWHGIIPDTVKIKKELGLD